MAPIGQQFKTGDVVPVYGAYDLVRHIDEVDCPKSEGISMAFVKGETFPPHKQCGKPCIWQLAYIYEKEMELQK